MQMPQYTSKTFIKWAPFKTMGEKLTPPMIQVGLSQNWTEVVWVNSHQVTADLKACQDANKKCTFYQLVTK